MKKYAIALKFLDFQDSSIIKIISKYSESQLKAVFDNKNNVFADDLEFFKYSEVFSDISMVKNSLEKAANVLNENRKYEIKTVLYNSKNYPNNLKTIDNPPAILYIKGRNFTKGHEKALACVGTRTPTKFAVNATNYLIPQWVNEEFIIISGLAIGVDTLSHIACIENKGTTVAVLAHGLDTIYPKENKDLANKILDNGGTLVSEYPIGTKADKFRFVNRNRLIVGLSKGTVVFESKVKSGTMHAVDYTIDQGKQVFCPKPGTEKDNENLEGLRFIINNKNAIPIPNGASFEIPVFNLGYKLKHSPVHVAKLKETYIKSLLSNTRMQVNVGDVLKALNDKENLKKKSIIVNDLQYDEFKKIAERNHISVKELINIVIDQIVINNTKN